MKYFLDTEFIEDGKTIDLVSIGIVAEDGRELYMVSTEADFRKADPWVRVNVLSKLPRFYEDKWYDRGVIRDSVLQFCDPTPEFWAYFADYDWVALCQLFGKMIDLPSGWPMYCRDLKQEMDRLGIKRSELPAQVDEHDALADARWVREAYLWMAKEWHL